MHLNLYISWPAVVEEESSKAESVFPWEQKTHQFEDESSDDEVSKSAPKAQQCVNAKMFLMT